MFVSETKPNFLEKITKSRPIIAIFDPNEIEAKKLEHILANNDYQALIIPDVMRGMGKILDYQPDLILLDLSLQAPDAYAVCRFITKSEVFQHIPVFLLAEKESQINLSRAEIFGAQGFILKSELESQLKPIAKSYLSQSLRKNQKK